MKPLHAIIIATLVVVGALYWYSHRQEQHYGPAAERYVRHALIDFGAWQRERIKPRLAPPTLAAINDTQLDALTERYRALGAFKRVDDLQFARLSAALSFFSSTILLSYQGTAVFENGSATFAITLVARDGSLQIYNFSFGNPQTKSQ